jgi:hypothetical protein
MASPGLTSPYGANFPGTPGFGPPPTTPGFAPPPTAPSHPTPPPGQGTGLPPPPPGGYSQFQYNNAAHPGSATPDYGIHQQLYRPTEQEHASKYSVYKPKVEAGQSKLGQNAERLERGVTGMFKKFEKKFG